MSFPVSPTNGQQSTIANIVYEYASATNSWTVVPGYANVITATGNITAANFITTGNAVVGNILTNGYYYANGVAFAGGGGTPGGSNTQVQFNDANTFSGTAAFTFNKTSNALSVSGNVSGGNVTTGGNIVATGNVSGGNVTTGGNIVATGNVSGGNLAAVTSIFSFGTIVGTSNVSGGNLTTTGAISATGNITGGGHVGTIYTNSIINTGSNATGNIGSSSLYFNTAFVKATSAQYADLAEMYQGDSSYMPGTVVEFGGTHEVTITTSESSTSIAGVVSTNPSYLMNSGLTSLNSVPVALTGRVPCQVLGPVKKGDRLVSSMLPGVAQALDESTYKPGCMIGKSLENWPEASVKLIEVVVGRL